MTAPEPLLAITDLRVAYGGIKALQGVSLHVMPGEIVTLIGANGAGKSTLLRAISGLVAVQGGTIRFAPGRPEDSPGPGAPPGRPARGEGLELTRTPAHRIAAAGLAHVPEGRGLFANLTVQENLRLATWTRRNHRDLRSDYDHVFAVFPRLAERRGQLAGSLSGGEQQMLAVGRALMMRSPLLLLDEPSMGLAPLLVQEIFRVLREINVGGTSLLLVEQNARQALKLAHRGYVLETGRMVLEGSSAQLLADQRVSDAYLGTA